MIGFVIALVVTLVASAILAVVIGWTIADEVRAQAEWREIRRTRGPRSLP